MSFPVNYLWRQKSDTVIYRNLQLLPVKTKFFLTGMLVSLNRAISSFGNFQMYTTGFLGIVKDNVLIFAKLLPFSDDKIVVRTIGDDSGGERFRWQLEYCGRR